MSSNPPRRRVSHTFPRPSGRPRRSAPRRRPASRAGGRRRPGCPWPRRRRTGLRGRDGRDPAGPGWEEIPRPSFGLLVIKRIFHFPVKEAGNPAPGTDRRRCTAGAAGLKVPRFPVFAVRDFNLVGSEAGEIERPFFPWTNVEAAANGASPGAKETAGHSFESAWARARAAALRISAGVNGLVMKAKAPIFKDSWAVLIVG